MDTENVGKTRSRLPHTSAHSASHRHAYCNSHMAHVEPGMRKDMSSKIQYLHMYEITVQLLLLLMFLPWFAMRAQISTGSESDRLHRAFIQSQGRFIENAGQFGEGVLYTTTSGLQQIFFYRDSVVVFRSRRTPALDDLRISRQRGGESFMSRMETHPKAHIPNAYDYEVQSLRLYPDSASAAPIAHGPRREVVNYLISFSPSNHHRSVATWDTLHYHDISDGYSLIFHFIHGELRWECVRNESPVMETDSITDTWIQYLNNELMILLPPPFNSGQAGNTVQHINQQLVYSTLLGGSKSEGIQSIISLNGNEYIFIGLTHSPDFPLAGIPFDSTFRGDTSSIYATMIFVTRLDVATNQIISSTYFGGSDLDGIASATYFEHNIVFAGSTWSDDLPVTANAWQPQYRGNGDGYIAALNPSGSELVFCSYIGGSGIENLKDMKIDTNGNIVITGLTDSWNYPTTPGVVQSSYGGGGDDIFVTKFNRDASELMFSTFLGGQGWDEGRSLRFTPQGDILVAGYTNSNDFPVTEDALYGSRQAYDEGCVFILTPGGRRLLYSTYIAWNTHEDAWAAHLDDNGVMTVFGGTSSTDLPVNENSFQKQKGDAPVFHPLVMDFYILKFRLDSAVILACTYLGGSGNERYPEVFMQLHGGNVLCGGTGTSPDYPATTILGAPSSANFAIELSILDSELSRMLYSIRYGGNGYSSLNYANIERTKLFLSGFTYSTDYPVTDDAWQTDHKGGTDAFFTILDLSSVLTGLESSALLPEAAILSQHYPNPVSGETTIPFSLSTPAHVSLSIHDLMGRRVLNVLEDYFDAGPHQVTISLGHLAPGTYFIRFLTARGMQSRLLHVF